MHYVKMINRNKLQEWLGAANGGTMKPNQASMLIVDVIEAALEAYQKIEALEEQLSQERNK